MSPARGCAHVPLRPQHECPWVTEVESDIQEPRPRQPGCCPTTGTPTTSRQRVEAQEYAPHTHMHTRTRLCTRRNVHTHTCTHADQHSSQPLRTLCGCLLSHSLALNASSLGLADVCSAFSLLAPAGLYLGPSPCSVAWKLSPDSKIGHTWVPPPSSRGSLCCAAQSSMSETGFCAFCPGFSCFKWEANFSPFLVRSRGTPGVFFTVFPFSSCLPWLPHRLRLIPG